jgi:hypothetical protein
MSFKVLKIFEPKSDVNLLPHVKGGITDADRKGFWNHYDEKRIKDVGLIKRANS